MRPLLKIQHMAEWIRSQNSGGDWNLESDSHAAFGGTIILTPMIQHHQMMKTSGDAGAKCVTRAEYKFVLIEFTTREECKQTPDS